MSHKDLKKSVKDHIEKLEKLGRILTETLFSYKIEKNSSKKYWEQRIKDFKKHDKTCMEYYTQICLLMKLFDDKKSAIFLIHTSKSHQLSLTLIKIMKKIKETPSISDSKDKQQSQWSKKVNAQYVEFSNKCQDHEIYMNTTFRDFYQKYLKEFL